MSLPIFMGPVLAIAIALKIQTWRERRHSPDASGKRSTLTVTNDEQKATITVTGPLDYPVLIELESALATDCAEAQAITLDLQELTQADQEAAWSLCDAIGRVRDMNGVDIQLAATKPYTETLTKTLTSEGISVSQIVQRQEPVR